jgi:hypothetical protein
MGSQDSSQQALGFLQNLRFSCYFPKVPEHLANFSVFAKVRTEIDLSEVNLGFRIDKNDN